MDAEVKPSSQTYLDDAEVKRLIALSQSGDHVSRDTLVNCNIRLVWSVVQRFMNRGYDPEDLFQIGCIGLLKSVDKFDLSYDVKFSTYAVPMIIGEIQRFLRDDGTLKVSRSLKEMANKVRKKRDELSKHLDRLPTIKEVAAELGVTPEEVVFAQEANKPPTSIHETVFENDGDPITLMDQIADESQERWFDKLALNEAIGGLSERERLIVYLRYYRDQTQSEVASRLGISQVQVSRLEKKYCNPFATRSRSDSGLQQQYWRLYTNIRQLTTFYRALRRGRLFVVSTGRSRTIGLHDQHHAKNTCHTNPLIEAKRFMEPYNGCSDSS